MLIMLKKSFDRLVSTRNRILPGYFSQLLVGGPCKSIEFQYQCQCRRDWPMMMVTNHRCGWLMNNDITVDLILTGPRRNKRERNCKTITEK